MFLPVSELQLRNLDFDLKIAPGELNFLDDTLRQESDLVVQGTASLRPSTREILVRGFLSVDVSFPCDRCLERVRQRIEKELSLNYLPEEMGPMEDEREIGEAEADIGFYSGGGIELDDLLRESVLLELPMRRVCQPACAAAPEKLLSVPAASGSGQMPDSRWEALGGLRLKKSNVEKPGE
jgi:uncharacterized metal-binding protein YceD (DUF177 family)